MVDPVVIDYADLMNPSVHLSAKVEEAYGPDGQGILTVSGVPDVPALRQRLLPLAAQFAQLPAAVRSEYEDPASSFNFGWSCGRELLQQGLPDCLKGSFYANPLCDEPTQDSELRRRFPAYCRPNLWPQQELPELRTAFRKLGALVVDVGLSVALRCDEYAASKGAALPPRHLHNVIKRSPCTKGRLLHYFPPNSPPYPALSRGNIKVQGEDGWCGWHTDHGSLTGLTSAMCLGTDSVGYAAEVSCPDPAAGLYIRTRAGAVVRAAIPPDHIAFQVGEAMQVHSGGLLRATPHCVRAPDAETAAGISRNTFAVFMQPKWDEPLNCPVGTGPRQVGVAHWTPGISFGEFSQRRFEAYYK